MPKAKIENLMTELHDRFGEVDPSPQQTRLLAELEQHMEAAEGETDPTPVETIELLLDNLGEDHPRVAAVLRELMDTLKNIGV